MNTKDWQKDPKMEESADDYAKLVAYIDSQRHRPPAGEVMVVSVLDHNKTYEPMVACPSAACVRLKPGQSLAIVEPSPGVTLGRDEDDRNRFHTALQRIARYTDSACCQACSGMRDIAKVALSGRPTDKDSPHA